MITLRGRFLLNNLPEHFNRSDVLSYGRPVRALSLVSKDSEFNPSARPSVVKTANHC